MRSKRLYQYFDIGKLTDKTDSSSIANEFFFETIFTSFIVKNWDSLLHQADKYRLTPQNTKYLKTYFQKDFETGNDYKLRIIFMKNEDLYSFDAEIENIIENEWSIGKMGINLDKYINIHDFYNRNEIPSFEWLMNRSPTQTYQYNNEFKCSNIKEEEHIISPVSFISDCISALKQDSLANHLILSKAKYEKLVMPYIIEHYKHISKPIPTKNEREEIDKIREQPIYFYDEYVTGSWKRIVEELKETSGERNLNNLEFTEGVVTIGNFPLLRYEGISLSTEYNVKIKDKSHSFYITAFLIENEWKLYFVSPLFEPYIQFQF